MKSGAIAAAVAFAAFVVAKGTPTLRHDWNWPIDRLAIPSFVNESVGGWLPVGFGVANAHPTTYLIALPLIGLMLVAGPLIALAAFAFATGYCCMRAAENVASQWGNAAPAAIGAGIFALFNPWVYNEVVAGHLVMVLAYGGVIGLLAEMTRGRAASPVRLALWLALIEAQLQFFIVAAGALVVFALVTKKWLAPIVGVLVALPSIVGLFAERGALLQTPYSVQWQANQSLSPIALLSLGGYFPGYADRLGLAAQTAIWVLCAFALAGVVAARRLRAVRWAAAVAGLVYLGALGVHGPLDAAYEWTVRSIPESGVFRELLRFRRNLRGAPYRACHGADRSGEGAWICRARRRRRLTHHLADPSAQRSLGRSPNVSASHDRGAAVFSGRPASGLSAAAIAQWRRRRRGS